jgi:hypothetical protein
MHDMPRFCMLGPHAYCTRTPSIRPVWIGVRHHFVGLPVAKNKCRAASPHADRQARLGSREATVDTGILRLLGRL